MEELDVERAIEMLRGLAKRFPRDWMMQ